MSDPATDMGEGFVVGFPSRRDAAAGVAMETRRGTPAGGFTPAELIARIEEAFGGGGLGNAGVQPRHFSPANRDVSPTAGWDPMDAGQPASAFVDPVEAARTAGYDEGYAAALAAQQESDTRDAGLTADVGAALAGGLAIDRALLAEQLRRTVLSLVTRIVGDAGVSGELLASRIKAATDCLADASESAMLRVHPDDVALLDGRLPSAVFAVGDAGIARGSFVMESASTVVEDGPAMWLNQLEAAIDRAALPAC